MVSHFNLLFFFICRGGGANDEVNRAPATFFVATATPIVVVQGTAINAGTARSDV
jgi:hypothetical protein